MIECELFEVIVALDRAYSKKRRSVTFRSPHRVGQILRILQVAYLEDMTHETAIDPVRRNRWEHFWDFPEVKARLGL